MPRRFQRDTESIRQLLRRLLPLFRAPPIADNQTAFVHTISLRQQPWLINGPYRIVGEIMAIEGERMRAAYNIKRFKIKCGSLRDVN